MKRKLFSIKIVSLLLLLLISTTSAYAQVISREQMKIDDGLYNVNQVIKFVEPKSIVIVPIEKPVDVWNVSGNDWYRGVYYYLAGRLGLGDIPFHYVVLSDGTVVEGIKNGEEVETQIQGGPASPIVVAYFNDNEIKDFDNISRKSLEDLILKLANSYAIKPQDISVKPVDFATGSEGFSMTATSPTGRYELTLNQIRESISSKYAPQEKTYKLSITEVGLPQTPVNPGDDVVVSISVKNDSEFTVFKDSTAEFLASKTNNSLSLFYINGEWASPSKSELMGENSLLRPGETMKFDMKLSIPLQFGEQVEDFQLTNLDGVAYAGTNFQIKLTINRITANVVEIQETETGSLNVRDRASTFGNVKTTVLPGQRFIEVSRNSTGWVEIDLGGGETGWVSAQYLKTV